MMHPQPFCEPGNAQFQAKIPSFGLVPSTVVLMSVAFALSFHLVSTFRHLPTEIFAGFCAIVMQGAWWKKDTG